MASVVFHGSNSRGIEEFKLRRRFVPGVEGDAAPPAVYASDDPAYAAGHSFPWTSSDGIDLGFCRDEFQREQVVLSVPEKLLERLKQPVFLYTLLGERFQLLPNVSPIGHNYRCLRTVKAIDVVEFDSVTEAVAYYGGKIEVIRDEQ